MVPKQTFTFSVRLFNTEDFARFHKNSLLVDSDCIFYTFNISRAGRKVSIRTLNELFHPNYNDSSFKSRVLYFAVLEAAPRYRRWLGYLGLFYW